MYFIKTDVRLVEKKKHPEDREYTDNFGKTWYIYFWKSRKEFEKFIFGEW